MDLSETFAALISDHALSLLFFNVLLEQAGLPIPSYPSLIVAGTLTLESDRISMISVFSLAVVACLIADTLWFLAGRRHGTWLMRGVCRISLSPDNCIRKSMYFYRQLGPRLLLIAKFLPGAGALTTLMAGTSGTSLTTFLLYDAAGSAIWVASALMIGILFDDAVGALLGLLTTYVVPGVMVVAACFAAFLLWKWVHRMRVLRRSRRVPRIQVSELMTLQADGVPFVLVDVRPGLGDDTASIPGSIKLALNAKPSELARLPSDTSIVIYCDCPDEVSAAYLAERIRATGRRDIYALQGGIDAWMDDALKDLPTN